MGYPRPLAFHTRCDGLASNTASYARCMNNHAATAMRLSMIVNRLCT
jgi:hypothetical protein